MRVDTKTKEVTLTEIEYHELINLLKSKPEVAIEKEIAEHAINMPHGEFTHESECAEHEEWAKGEFRHFYELGLNARKFEKDLDRIWFDNKFGNRFDNSAVNFANVREICKHFYELGFSARKEEKK